MALRTGLLSALIAGGLLLVSDQAAGQLTNEGPRVITAMQYKCLLKHLDQITVSRRGTVFDLTRCPPMPVLGAFPPGPSQKYIVLTPRDLDCLSMSTQRGQRIAVMRARRKVALYLNPCGNR